MTIIKTVKSITTISQHCKKTITSLTLSLAMVCGVSVAQQATNLDDLLNQLQQGKIAQSKQNKTREAEFKAKVNQQQSMLDDIKSKRNSAIELSAQLEQLFADNEIELANKTDALDKRLGELKELFGVLQQVSGDTQSKFQTSVISAQIPARGEFLNEFSQSMGVKQ